MFYKKIVLFQFVKFSNIEEDTPSYHRRYDFFVSKFSSMCHCGDKHGKLILSKLVLMFCVFFVGYHVVASWLVCFLISNIFRCFDIAFIL